jgi:hypothetical protein
MATSRNTTDIENQQVARLQEEMNREIADRVRKHNEKQMNPDQLLAHNQEQFRNLQEEYYGGNFSGSRGKYLENRLAELEQTLGSNSVEQRSAAAPSQQPPMGRVTNAPSPRVSPAEQAKIDEYRRRLATPGYKPPSRRSASSRANQALYSQSRTYNPRRYAGGSYENQFGIWGGDKRRMANEWDDLGRPQEMLSSQAPANLGPGANDPYTSGAMGAADGGSSINPTQTGSPDGLVSGPSDAPGPTLEQASLGQQAGAGQVAETAQQQDASTDLASQNTFGLQPGQVPGGIPGMGYATNALGDGTSGLSVGSLGAGVGSLGAGINPLAPTGEQSHLPLEKQSEMLGYDMMDDPSAQAELGMDVAPAEEAESMAAELERLSREMDDSISRAVVSHQLEFIDKDKSLSQEEKLAKAVNAARVEKQKLRNEITERTLDMVYGEGEGQDGFGSLVEEIANGNVQFSDIYNNPNTSPAVKRELARLIADPGIRNILIPPRGNVNAGFNGGGGYEGPATLGAWNRFSQEDQSMYARQMRNDYQSQFEGIEDAEKMPYDLWKRFNAPEPVLNARYEAHVLSQEAMGLEPPSSYDAWLTKNQEVAERQWEYRKRLPERQAAFKSLSSERRAARARAKENKTFLRSINPLVRAMGFTGSEKYASLPVTERASLWRDTINQADLSKLMLFFEHSQFMDDPNVKEMRDAELQVHNAKMGKDINGRSLGGADTEKAIAEAQKSFNKALYIAATSPAAQRLISMHDDDNARMVPFAEDGLRAREEQRKQEAMLARTAATADARLLRDRALQEDRLERDRLQAEETARRDARQQEDRMELQRFKQNASEVGTSARENGYEIFSLTSAQIDAGVREASIEAAFNTLVGQEHTYKPNPGSEEELTFTLTNRNVAQAIATIETLPDKPVDRAVMSSMDPQRLAILDLVAGAMIIGERQFYQGQSDPAQQTLGMDADFNPASVQGQPDQGSATTQTTQWHFDLLNELAGGKQISHSDLLNMYKEEVNRQGVKPDQMIIENLKPATAN